MYKCPRVATNIDYPITQKDIETERHIECHQYVQYVRDNKNMWGNVKFIMEKYSEFYKSKDSAFLSDLWLDEKSEYDIYDNIKNIVFKSEDDDDDYITFSNEYCQHLLENFRVPSRIKDGWLFEANNNWNYTIYIYTNENIYRISGYPKSEEDEIFEIIPIF